MDGALLIADDSRTARDLLRTLVERERLFATIVEAHDGASALRLMNEVLPMVVACDLEMPGFDGRWLLKARARVEKLRQIPVIVISGSTDLDERAEILELGAADFIAKPFHEKELLARIRIQRRLITLQDALRSSNERLEALANSDPLTGLSNRRQLEAILDRESRSAERYRHPLSVVMVDIDHFKRVNDEWGHAAGDAVLVGVAKTLAGGARATDYVARFGGEEMTLVFPHTGAEGALIATERLRERIAEGVHISGDSRISVTASFGIATQPPDGVAIPPAELMRRADRALYDAKRLGRNRVVAWSPALEG